MTLSPTRQTQLDAAVLFGYLADAARERVEVEEFATPSSQPALSVVVPAYNHAAFLPDLLSALAPQLVDANAELVIVDNGSLDDSSATIRHLAASLNVPGRLVRLSPNRGRARARNVGVVHAHAPIVAFTDSDCAPAAGWLAAAARPFDDDQVGVVQGRTLPRADQPRPFFNHFIDIERFDGTYSTCNVVYRRAAVCGVGGFDPGLDYWEDVDLGWRVHRAGWLAAYAPGAIVFHQVIPLSPLAWLRWPSHFWPMPAKVRAYPEYRAFLFFHFWVDPLHALFSLAVVSVMLGLLWQRKYLALAAPYAVAFPAYRGLNGRAPLAKVLFHLAWDAVSFAVLLASSVRHRALVL